MFIWRGSRWREINTGTRGRRKTGTEKVYGLYLFISSDLAVGARGQVRHTGNSYYGESLRRGVTYVFNLEGKRIRPVL